MSIYISDVNRELLFYENSGVYQINFTLQNLAISNNNNTIELFLIAGEEFKKRFIIPLNIDSNALQTITFSLEDSQSRLLLENNIKASVYVLNEYKKIIDRSYYSLQIQRSDDEQDIEETFTNEYASFRFFKEENSHYKMEMDLNYSTIDNVTFTTGGNSFTASSRTVLSVLNDLFKPIKEVFNSRTDIDLYNMNFFNRFTGQSLSSEFLSLRYYPGQFKNLVEYYIFENVGQDIEIQIQINNTTAQSYSLPLDLKQEVYDRVNNEIILISRENIADLDYVDVSIEKLDENIYLSFSAESDYRFIDELSISNLRLKCDYNGRYNFNLPQTFSQDFLPGSEIADINLFNIENKTLLDLSSTSYYPVYPENGNIYFSESYSGLQRVIDNDVKRNFLKIEYDLFNRESGNTAIKSSNITNINFNPTFKTQINSTKNSRLNIVQYLNALNDNLSFNQGLNELTINFTNIFDMFSNLAYDNMETFLENLFIDILYISNDSGEKVVVRRDSIFTKDLLTNAGDDQNAIIETDDISDNVTSVIVGGFVFHSDIDTDAEARLELSRINPNANILEIASVTANIFSDSTISSETVSNLFDILDSSNINIRRIF